MKGLGISHVRFDWASATCPNYLRMQRAAYLQLLVALALALETPVRHIIPV
jgi:hypothetical protein